MIKKFYLYIINILVFINKYVFKLRNLIWKV